jgi:hypothetical protein
MTLDDLAIGQLWQTKRTVDRFPDFVLPPGLIGEIVEFETVVALRMDLVCSFLDPWNNEVWWATAEEFFDDCEPLVEVF